jgi:hypothetical protein
MNSKSPAAAYFSKTNIAHPGTAAQVAAALVQARLDIGAELPPNGGTQPAVTNGAIKRAL